MTIAKDLTDLVGKTPLLELGRLYEKPESRILAKMENLNPMSIKDRAVLSMINRALEDGKISTHTEVVEATSGNTGIAIASLGAVMGFRVRLFMSELCSVERQKILCAYGAKVVVTPGIEHTKGARKRAMAYCDKNRETTYFLNQHANPANGMAHEETTGPEIWDQTGGNIDAVVIGLGTSGTFDGLARYFKGKNSKINIIGFEPASSPVYSGGPQGKHKIIGIGPGFVTDNFKRSSHLIDELLTVEDDIAFEWTRKIAAKEGLLLGPSSGAAAWVAGQLAGRDEFKGRTIVCIFYDTGERYLSTDGLFDELKVEQDF